MKLLICSLSVPFDFVAHAGGQTHNYYIKKLKRETTIDIHLVTFSDPAENEYIDLDKYGISSSIICRGNFSFLKRIIRKGTRIICKMFPKINYWGLFSLFEKYLMLKELKKLKKDGFRPDAVELDWTQIIFFYQSIKKIFPDAKYYAFEHDVTFLKFERIFLNENNIKKQIEMKKQYISIKKAELTVLKYFIIVFVQNNKDRNLLLNNGLPESHVIAITPFFNKYSIPVTTEKKNAILFYGAMAREENYTAAIWFIENVFSKIKNNNLIFTILGSNPHHELKKYENNNIIITGYQQDIQPYFEKALCMAAPLILGAGIKVKVLEALAAGIPVLGSEVASEGINVTDKVNFFHCKTPSEYIECIHELSVNTELRMTVSIAAKNLIDDEYNFNESFKIYVNSIQGIPC